MEYIATYHTDVGTRKETNQDSLAIKVVNTKEGNVAFAIVCDGMGGLAKGEVASKEVIEAFCTWFDDTLVDEIQNGTFTEQNLVSQWDDIIQIQNRRLGAYGVRVAMIAGTEHPNPISIGTKLLPDNPILRSGLSMTNATRAI